MTKTLKLSPRKPPDFAWKRIEEILSTQGLSDEEIRAAKEEVLRDLEKLHGQGMKFVSEGTAFQMVKNIHVGEVCFSISADYSPQGSSLLSRVICWIRGN